MGYISSYDLTDEHEGWVAMVFMDGTLSSGTSSGLGIYAEGYTYLPHDDNDTRTWGIIDPAFLRPFADVRGWVPRCECGWIGVETDVILSGDDADKWRDPTDDQEHLIMGQWRIHLRDVFPEAYSREAVTVSA